MRVDETIDFKNNGNWLNWRLVIHLIYWHLFYYWKNIRKIKNHYSPRS